MIPVRGIQSLNAETAPRQGAAARDVLHVGRAGVGKEGREKSTILVPSSV